MPPRPPNPLNSVLWQSSGNKEMSSRIQLKLSFIESDPLFSWLHITVCVMFTINYTQTWQPTVFFQQRPGFLFKCLKWKSWRVTTWRRTFERPSKSPLREIKARPERDHRLQLQQRAAVIEVITRNPERAESWHSKPQLTPSSSTSSPKQPSRSPWLLSKGSQAGHAKIIYRKELGRAWHNQSFSSNSKPSSVLCGFLSFPV